MGELSQAFFSGPARFLQTTYWALFRPKKLAVNRIILANRRSLRKAVRYWFTALAVTFAIGAITYPLVGNLDDMAAPDGFGQAFHTFAETLRRSPIFGQLLQTLLFVVFCLFWYSMLRLLRVRRDQLSVADFVQCAAYPAGAVGILVTVFTVIFTFTLWGAYDPDLAAIDLVRANPQFGSSCATPTSLTCKYSAFLMAHPGAMGFVSLAYIIPYVLTWADIAIIIKEKTGIRKRRSLGALLLALFVGLVLYIAAIFWFVASLGPGAFAP